MSCTSFKRNANDIVIGEPNESLTTSINPSFCFESLVQHASKSGCENTSEDLRKAAEEIIKKNQQLRPSGRFLRRNETGKFFLASEAEILQYTLITLRKAFATSSLLRLATETRSVMAPFSSGLDDQEQCATDYRIGSSPGVDSSIKKYVPSINLSSSFLHNVPDEKSNFEKLSGTHNIFPDQPCSSSTEHIISAGNPEKSSVMKEFTELEMPKLSRQITPEEKIQNHHSPIKKSDRNASDSKSPVMTEFIELGMPKLIRQVTPEEKIQDHHRPIKKSNRNASDSYISKIRNGLPDQLDKIKFASRKTHSASKFIAGTVDAFVPNENDVLLGFPESAYYNGNIQLQNYVLSIFKKSDRSRPLSEHSLSRFAHLVFYEILNLAPSGRFLHREGISGRVIETSQKAALSHIINEFHKADVATSFSAFSKFNTAHPCTNKNNEKQQGNNDFHRSCSILYRESPSSHNKRKCERIHDTQVVRMSSEGNIKSQTYKQGETEYKRKCVKFNPIVRVCEIPQRRKV